MKFSQATQGRVFVIRLEDGDILHECVERLAREKRVKCAYLVAVGGADRGSRLVVGPARARARPVRPMEYVLSNVHEIAAVGTVFPDEEGRPVLHMHAACGRKDRSRTGCVRRGVKVWHILEMVMVELTGCRGRRVKDRATGFQLLKP